MWWLLIQTRLCTTPPRRCCATISGVCPWSTARTLVMWLDIWEDRESWQRGCVDWMRNTYASPAGSDHAGRESVFEPARSQFPDNNLAEASGSRTHHRRRKTTTAGFEDREDHRTPCASVSDCTALMLAGGLGFCIGLGQRSAHVKRTGLLLMRAKTFTALRLASG